MATTVITTKPQQQLPGQISAQYEYFMRRGWQHCLQSKIFSLPSDLLRALAATASFGGKLSVMASTSRQTRSRNVHIALQDVERLLTEMDSSDIEGMSDGDEEPPTVFDININDNDDSDEDPTYEPVLEKSSITSSDSETENNTNKRKKKTGRKSGDSTEPPPKKSSQKVKKLLPPPWIEKDFTPEPTHLLEPSYPEVSTESWSQFTYVNQYINDEILELMVNKSNQHHVFLTGKTLNLSLSELKVWLGCNFVMASLQYPKIRMYWQAKWRVSLIADVMSRDRFFWIRRSLKLVFDNEVSQEARAKDRLWKVRPLINNVVACCHTIPRSQNISMDEMMIPFSGACKVRQYVPNKPNPLGLKAFVLANPNGIVCDFEIYQGSTTFPDDMKSKYGMCECAVLLMTRSLVPGHVIYVDRFYTTMRLPDYLLNVGIRLTGTLDKHRTSKEVMPKSDKLLSEMGRGTSDMKVRPDGAVAITKWFDNKPVTMISTNEGQYPTHVVQRWSKAEKKYVQVEQPQVVHSYNQNMGGVDLADRMLSYCSSRARTKKWTIRLILHLLDMSICNAWLQYREDQKQLEVPMHKIMQLRTYKLEYGQSLIESHDLPHSFGNEDEIVPENDLTPKRSIPTPIPSKERRIQGADHLPTVTGGVQQRCRNAKCFKKTSVKCTKCNVYLCLTAKRNCFTTFHCK